MKKQQKSKVSLKNRIKNTIIRIKRSIPYALTAIAGIAISWYCLESFDSISTWYSLPIIALFTGLITLIIPFKGKTSQPVYAVTSAGLAIFAILIIDEYVTSSILRIIFFSAIVLIIGFLTDLILSESKPTIEDFIIDSILAILGAVSVTFLPSTSAIVMLIIAYYLVIYLQVKPEYTQRFKKSQKDISTSE